MDTFVCELDELDELTCRGDEAKPINNKSDAVKNLMMQLIRIEKSLKRINASF